MRYNLSEIADLIKDRRTIYPEQYSSRKVAREIVENILRSATWAPTHGKTEPWRFTVFMGNETMRVAEAQQVYYRANTPEDRFSEHKVNRYATRAEATSVIIGVGMKRQESGKIPEIEEVMAVACGVQNMMLHAAAYGVGSYWSSGGFAFSEDSKKMLGLDAPDDQALGYIYLGYPAVDWPKSHRKPLEYVTNWKES